MNIGTPILYFKNGVWIPPNFWFCGRNGRDCDTHKTNPKYPIHLHTLNFRVVLHEPLPLFASDKLVHEGGVIAIVHHQLGTGFPA